MSYTHVIDSITKIPIRISYPHHQIHNGNHYFIAYSALADKDDLIELRVGVPSSVYPHMIIEVIGEEAALVEMFINTTKTHVSGNAITPFNRNQNSSNTSSLIICYTPGGSQAGSGDLLQYIGAADGAGTSTTGGSASSREEFILKQGTNYLIRNTSRANNNSLTILLDWYELS